MRVKLFQSFWGMDGTEEERVRRIADAGYDGFEAPLQDEADAGRLGELSARFGLPCIPQIQTDGDHFASFCRKAAFAARLRPPVIVSHTGRDWMTPQEQDDLFRRILEYERELPSPVGHETHRSRPTCAPWSTARLLRHFPQLRLTADLSHWCCVCETLLEDQAPSVELALSRAVHIHARVGYAQGPQVPHPGAPEWTREREVHESWWGRIARRLDGEGQDVTVTVEYGPPPYLHTQPYTNQPAADLWEICLWGARRLRELKPIWEDRSHEI